MEKRRGVGAGRCVVPRFREEGCGPLGRGTDCREYVTASGRDVQPAESGAFHLSPRGCRIADAQVDGSARSMPGSRSGAPSRTIDTRAPQRQRRYTLRDRGACASTRDSQRPAHCGMPHTSWTRGARGGSFALTARKGGKPGGGLPARPAFSCCSTFLSSLCTCRRSSSARRRSGSGSA